MPNIAVAQNLSNTEPATQTFLTQLWGTGLETAFVSGKCPSGAWTDTPVRSIGAAWAEIKRRSNHDTYMSVATFNDAAGRTARNAKSLRAFFLDLDCGAKKASAGKGYATKKEAAKAVSEFCLRMGFPAPSIVDSGHGLHVYWFLDLPMPAARWKLRAEQLKALTHEHGLLADDAVTADAARVLRVPGTFNHKAAANAKPVILKRASPPVSAETFIATIERAHGKISAGRPEAVPAFMMAGEPGNLANVAPSETPEAVARMQSALDSITPDCDRVTWRDAVWSTMAHGWPCCERIARTWSKHGVKYDVADFDSVVKSYRPTGGIHTGTLYHLAKLHGWTDPIQKAAPVNSVESLANTEPGDMQAARVFATINKGKLLYVSQAGRWMRWDGARWAWCGIGEEMAAAKRTADVFLDHCIGLVRQDAERHKKRLAFALRLQNLPRLGAMLQLAQSEAGMSVGTMTELDSDPWLLGTPDGVVDLKTGAKLAPNPAMLITRQTGATYERGATCPKWLAFLDSVMEGDLETVGFLQRALGYTLTGVTTAELLFICYGFGANGKSVFSNVVSRILGEYSQMAPPSLLTARKDGDSAPRNDIARLCGARSLQINELNHGDRLDEQVVKMLAGREQLSARFLHREFFDFWPTAKPWLRTNHRPIVTGDDDGIWRRLALIPFRRKYAEDERNPWLEQQLMEESAGILAWMVDGCLEWQRIGMAPSPLVRSESASYRTESDLLGEFLQDACASDPNGRELQTTVFGRWRMWCEGNGLRCGAKASFTRKLSERGFKEARSNGARYYSGIKLRGATGV